MHLLVAMRCYVLLAALLLSSCHGELDCDELERVEESEADALRVQLLQQKVRRQHETLNQVPSSERFSLPMARAFAALSQAAFCGADETLRNWTCSACHSVGFTLSAGTTRLVRQAELGEADSTFIFAARMKWLEGEHSQHAWPPARPRESLKNPKEDCYGHCAKRGGFCAWCGVGNACCRQGEASDPAECFNATFSGVEHHECVEVPSPARHIPVQHEHEDCWIYCGKAGGFCDWCGAGNACCKAGYEFDPIECRGAKNASDQHHVCTALSPTVPTPTSNDFGCVLAIRGSKTFTNALHDAFFWSDALPHEDCEGCQVFDGFWRVWTGIESKVERVLVDNGCIPGTSQGTIVLTGHSLGAAVATLAMYMLQLRGYSVGLSYNFASPRVGNDAYHDAFAKMFNRTVPLYRITRGRDPVVHVPPLPIYHHVGSEAYFSGKSQEDVVVCLDAEDAKCPPPRHSAGHLQPLKV
ncbi:Mono- and diacylglycerol lipase (MDGL), partial [Durusdinium trenchii]